MLYILSSFKNDLLNKKLVNELERKDLKVYYPKRDTDQNNFCEENLRAINASNLVIAVLDYTGRDFCFEVGYCVAKSKTIVPVFFEFNSCTEEESMLFKFLKNPIKIMSK